MRVYRSVDGNDDVCTLFVNGDDVTGFYADYDIETVKSVAQEILTKPRFATEPLADCQEEVNNATLIWDSEIEESPL